MTSTTDRRRPASGSRRAYGFTLLELVVCIGILVLLAGILLPAYSRIVRESKRAMTGARLQAIATAIQAYHDDFKIYPPLATFASGPNVGMPIPHTGFAALANCLMGLGGFMPGGAMNGDYNAASQYGVGYQVRYSGAIYLSYDDPGAAPPTDTTKWVAWDGIDGLDGLGFKLRRQYASPPTPNTSDIVSGRTYGPYLSEEYIGNRYALTDGNNQVIMYYVATGRKLGSTLSSGSTVPYVSTPAEANYFDTCYNANDSALLPLGAMQVLMGDSNGDGQINGSEKAATNAPYLLWAPGPDRIYGFDSNGRCDDVANFDLSR